MSWDKNTIITSEIDTTIAVLNEVGIEYQLSKIGQVRALGLNDDFRGIDYYPIRRLRYLGKVILERMTRADDCDMDDIIMSYKFDLDEEPSQWDIEETAEIQED